MTNPQFVPRTFLAAREAKPLTQSALARASGVSQAQISKIENGQLAPSDDQVRAIGMVLDKPVSFFQSDLPTLRLPATLFRKKKSLSQTAIKMIRARLAIVRREISILIRSVELPEVSVPTYEFDGLEGGPTEAAQLVRDYWNVASGPIANMVELIESKGILVAQGDFSTEKFDALSCWDNDLPPIILFNPGMQPDRLRFTLAHELGHFVLRHHHSIPSDDLERQANEFASEFLLPGPEIRGQLVRLNLQKLAQLKRYWKVSMQALIMRAGSLGCISPRKKRWLFSQMSSYGWRKREPVQVKRETPSIVREIIKVHLEQLRYSDEQLAAALHMNQDRFLRLVDRKEYNLRLVDNTN